MENCEKINPDYENNLSKNFSLTFNKINQKYTDKSHSDLKLPLFFDFYKIEQDFQNVYEPAEDTFLLIDSLKLEIFNNQIFSKENDQNFKSVEVGCGNGLVSCCFLNELTKFFENSQLNLTHFLIDINPDALKLTKKILETCEIDEFSKRIKKSNIKLEFLNSNIFSTCQDQKFDLIFFNPPYVTTDQEELERAKREKDIYASWAGGDNGSQIIFEFIEGLGEVLKENTILYMLLSQENEYNKIFRVLEEKYGFAPECLLRRTAVNENLAVFKFIRSSLKTFL